MDDNLEIAIQLRKQGQFEVSRNVLHALIDAKQDIAQAHLHIAWSYDSQGSEREAVEHYELALSGELSLEDRFDALLGLASTLRSLGQYQKALTFFEQAVSEYPSAKQILPFYSMCLYNLGRHKQAITILLNLLIEETDNQAILNYQSAIKIYAQDIDKTW